MKDKTFYFLLGFAASIFVGVLAYVINPYIFLLTISGVYLYLLVKGYSFLLSKAKDKLNHTWYVTFAIGFISLMIAVAFSARVGKSKIMLFPALFFYLIFFAVLIYHIFGFVKKDVMRFIERMRDMYGKIDR